MNRTLVALTCTALVSLSACGGGSGGAPTDASMADFCESIVDSPDEMAEPTDEGVEAAHDYADELRDIGTPEGMPDDARAGWEGYVDFLADIDVDTIEEAEDSEASDFFDGQQLDDFEALSEYTADCGPGEYDEDE